MVGQYRGKIKRIFIGLDDLDLLSRLRRMFRRWMGKEIRGHFAFAIRFLEIFHA